MNKERVVRHYLQLAHDKGGGWQMALFMMADDLERAIAGLALAYPLNQPHRENDERPEEQPQGSGVTARR